MPYMKVSVAKKLTEEERQELSKGLGEALGLIPGKHPSFLIADIEDGRNFYLGGMRQENFAFIDVRYYSKFSFQVKERFTKACFEALNKVLGTAKEQMFLTISEFSTWGGFGDFVDEYVEKSE
ncbi:MAG: hypothetical protein IJ017_03165 [Oscillospiraceae bacterium]|nr:hypothetical protein [Oscillospiraceae bacterium]